MSPRFATPKVGTPSAAKVLVAGTFDRLHPGHRHFLAQAAALGTLFVVVARDASVQKMKGHPPQQNERSRLARVAACPAVAAARLGHPTDFLQPLRALQPDIVALGYDQTTFTITDLRRQLRACGLSPRIVRLKSFCPRQFKTSLLK